MTSIPSGDTDWSNVGNVAEALIAIRESLGHFPSVIELRRMGHGRMYDAIRGHGGIEQMRERCGVDRQKVPTGNWASFDNVAATLRPIIAELGRMPSNHDLRIRKLSSVARAISDYHGGMETVERRLAETDAAMRPVHRALPARYWEPYERVEKALNAWVLEHGSFPTNEELSKTGRGDLKRGIQKFHGGMAAVRERMGHAPPNDTKANGYWADKAVVIAHLNELRLALGHFPTQSEMPSSLNHGIARHHGGLQRLQIEMGYPLTRRLNGWCETFEDFASALEKVIETIGHFPTQTELGAHRVSSIHAGAQRYGGLLAVRDRLGYGPVTDETLASHADALAQIVPALGANPTVLWSRMKRSWTTRDLDAAIAAHAETGSLAAFRRLLDG